MSAELPSALQSILLALAVICLAVDLFCDYAEVAFYFRFGIPIFWKKVDIGMMGTISDLIERTENKQLLSRRVRLIMLSNALAAVRLRSRAVSTSLTPPMHAGLRLEQTPSGSRLTIVGYLNFYVVPLALAVLIYFDNGIIEFGIAFCVLWFFLASGYNIQGEYYRFILDSIEDLSSELARQNETRV